MTDAAKNRLRVIVVMGVSGAGKTRIGRALAEAIGWAFVDADEYHSPENKAKMHRGEGLSDADREPWLAEVRAALVSELQSGHHVVLACSALRQRYRDELHPPRVPADTVQFVFLNVPREVLAERLRTRKGHFATITLLDSQLATLEPPREALWVDGTRTPSDIVATIRQALEV